MFELNNFLIVWNKLAHLSRDCLKIRQVDKIAKILSWEHLCQNKKNFTLAGRFQPSLSFSKNKTYFFRIAWININKRGSSIFKKIFGLYENELGLSLDAVEFIVNRFFRLSPYVAFGMDGDMPRLKIYSQLEFHKRNGTTNDDIIKSILKLADFLNIGVRKNYVDLFSRGKIVFNNICIDFYPNKKYAIKVYLQLYKENAQKELCGLIPRLEMSNELICKVKGSLLCYAFSGKNKNEVTKSLYLRFDRYPLDFNFSSIFKSLGYKGGAALRKFIDANKITSMPIVSFLAFGKDKFTVYFRSGLSCFRKTHRLKKV